MLLFTSFSVWKYTFDSLSCTTRSVDLIVEAIEPGLRLELLGLSSRLPFVPLTFSLYR